MPFFFFFHIEIKAIKTQNLFFFLLLLFCSAVQEPEIGTKEYWKESAKWKRRKLKILRNTRIKNEEQQQQGDWKGVKSS